MKRIESFAPIANTHSKVLILGTMPGAQSLKFGQYYANPRNYFWRIMGEIFGFDSSLDYESRLQILLSQKIALWDVIHLCERKGSLDSDIRTETVFENNFADFFSEFERIRWVFFNGTKAEEQFKKKVIPKLGELKSKLTYSRLPSTSPAMTRMTFEQKLLKWRQIKDIVTP